MNLPRFSVRNPVAVNLLMWGIVVCGLLAWRTMVREFFPALRTEQISILVSYPGATPTDVERAIALRIERRIRDIDGIEEIETTVIEGACVVLVTLDERADRDRVLAEVRSDVDEVKAEFPQDADDPEIVEVRPYIPVIGVVIAGDVPEDRLRRAALDVRDDLLDLAGITEVRVLGVRKREIWVEIDPDRLEELGLTFEQVGGRLAAANLDLPGGELRTPTGNVRVRTAQESRRALPIERIPAAVALDGSVLRLGDVARVRETFEDRVMRGRYEGVPAVSLVVFKTPEQDALEISRAVKDYVSKNPTKLDGAVRLAVRSDLARFIEQRLDLMVRNARAGLLLVLATLALFLSWRTAFWVAAGLPISLLGAFVVMALFGQSINLLSLFSLIVVLGLLVDDAVVIGEAVHRRIQRGEPPIEATVRGATEMALPVVAAVLTTVVAFLPMAFMEGRWGDFMRVLPIVVGSALIVSLVEAFVILPSHLAHARHATPGSEGPRGAASRPSLAARFGAWRDRVLDRGMERRFRSFLERMLPLRWPVIAGGLAVLLLTAGLFRGGILPFVLVQEVDAESITVTLEMSAGTPEEKTVETIAAIEGQARRFPEVASVFSVVGASFSDRGQEANADPATIGQVYIELLPADEREERGMRDSGRIIEEMRRRTGDLPGVAKLSYRAESGRAPGSDIELRIRNEELAVASAAADFAIDVLRGYEGVTEIEKDLREGKLEARVRLRDDARPLGLEARDVARAVRHALFGFEAQELQEEDDEVKVRVLLPRERRRALSDVLGLRIPAPTGARVPLSEVVEVSTERGYATLKRVDGRRAVTVRAEVDENVANVAEITNDFGRRLSDLPERFPGTTFSFEGRRKETREAFGSLRIGFPIALFAIYAIVAVLFRSYAQPILVMVVIPFALVGAVIGHLVLGFPFTLLSTIGCVALSGIVVNDSLILVDVVNRLRRDGLDLEHAVVEGSASRLRAILLTTITTAAGLFPLLLERSFQAQFLIPMAVSIVFGLVFATAVTLVLLPCLYLAYEDLARPLRRLLGLRATHDPATARA